MSQNLIDRAAKLLANAEQALTAGLDLTASANAQVAQGLLALAAAESAIYCEHGGTGVCMFCLREAVSR